MADYGNFSAIPISALDAKTDPTPKKNQTFHPLMGHIVVNDQYVPVYDKDNLKQEYTDYVTRQLGLGKEIMKNNRVLSGLAAPGTYLNKKNADLVLIGQKCAETYRSVFITYSNKGYSEEEARRYALESARDRKKSLMDVHEIEFPTDVAKTAVHRLSGANAIGDLKVADTI